MSTALIGLGAMGLGMARNILGAGIPLTGFDLSQKALAQFESLGGSVAESAAAAAEGAELLVVMVVNADQARAVLFDAGAAEAMAPGGVVVLTSTISPGDARDISNRLADMGLMAIDAPVSGGQVGADAGELTVMASGPQAAFEIADPVLAAISANLHRLGTENGIGATYKVVHQLAAGVHLVVAAELMALGAKAGCDPRTLLEIVTTSAGNSWMLGNRGPRMLVERPEVTSAVDIFVKDVGLALDLGKQTQAPLPLAAAAHQMLLGASALGHGRDDDSLVIRAYEALTGKPVHTC